jgi:hypothetical protein
MDLRYSHKKQRAKLSFSSLPIGDTPVQIFLSQLMLCDLQRPFPVGNDSTNLQGKESNIYDIYHV